jgi:hypothetical protein
MSDSQNKAAYKNGMGNSADLHDAHRVRNQVLIPIYARFNAQQGRQRNQTGGQVRRLFKVPEVFLRCLFLDPYHFEVVRSDTKCRLIADCFAY